MQHQKQRTVAAGFIHSIAITQNGDVLGFGSNKCNQLGVPYTDELVTIPEFSNKQNWHVACGRFFSVVLTSSSNNRSNDIIKSNAEAYIFGKITTGEGVQFPSPTRLILPTPVTFVACGKNHCMFIANKYLYGLGSNESEQLGHAMNCVFLTNPVKIKLQHNSVEESPELLSCGDNHTVIITKTSDDKWSIWTCGSNSNSQCLLTPSETSVLQKLTHNKLPVWDEICKYNTPTLLASGAYHNLLVFYSNDPNSSECSIYGWGSNSKCQVTINSYVGNTSALLRLKTVESFINHVSVNFKECSSKITCISCGFSHSIALVDNNYAVSWGENNYGQSGTRDRYEFLEVNETCFGVVELDGPPNVKLIDVCCGTQHSLFVSSNSRMFVQGRNRLGLLALSSHNKQEAIYKAIQNPYIFLRGYFWSIEMHYSCSLNFKQFVLLFLLLRNRLSYLNCLPPEMLYILFSKMLTIVK